MVAPTAADCFRLLAAGKHDAILISKLVGMQALQALQTLKIDNVRPLDIKAGFPQKFSFAVQKGKADQLASINEGISLTKLNGTYDAIRFVFGRAPLGKWRGYVEKQGGCRL